MMKQSGLVKEEVRRIASETNQFNPYMFQVDSDCKFQMSGKIKDICRRLLAGATLLFFGTSSTQKHPMTAPQTSENQVLTPAGTIYYIFRSCCLSKNVWNAEASERCAVLWQHDWIRQSLQRYRYPGKNEQVQFKVQHAVISYQIPVKVSTGGCLQE